MTTLTRNTLWVALLAIALAGPGYAQDGTSDGSSQVGNVQGYDMTWTASAPVGNLQQVLFTVDRLDVQRIVVTDTLVIFLTP